MLTAVLYADRRGPYPSMTGDDHELYAVDGAGCWADGHIHVGGPVSGDARLYVGPGPVVAHPPCKHWGRLRHLAIVSCDETDCEWRGRRCDLGGDWDGDHSRCPECAGHRVNFDGRNCGPIAVGQVRSLGGVLEHPAGSKLWEFCKLPRPTRQRVENVNGATVGWALVYPPPYVALDEFGGWSVELDQCEWGHVARKRTWLYLVGVPRSALEAPPFPGRQPTHYASGGRTSSSRTGGAVPPGMKVCSAQQRNRTPLLFAEYLVRLARAAGEARRAA
jgi:hypothetical protein